MEDTAPSDSIIDLGTGSIDTEEDAAQANRSQELQVRFLDYGSISSDVHLKAVIASILKDVSNMRIKERLPPQQIETRYPIVFEPVKQMNRELKVQRMRLIAEETCGAAMLAIQITSSGDIPAGTR